jgi:cytochrome c oxidase subunit 3
MTSKTLDVSHLPPYEISANTPLWLGQLSLTFVEATMFGVMIAMYFYYRLSVDVWPPPGVLAFDQILPAICLLLLIVSCAGSYIASEAAKKNNRRRVIAGLALNLALAIAAMILRGINWGTWNFSWRTSTYGSIVWGIMFLHTLDVVADLLFTSVLLIVFLLPRFGPRERLAVHVDSVVWYFLVLMWIPLYVTIFWGPHLVGAQ